MTIVFWLFAAIKLLFIIIIPDDVAICLMCKIFVVIIYTLAARIIVCLFHIICLFSLG